VAAASEFDLKINVNKTKEMRVNTLITKKQITQGQEVEEIDACQHLGSLLTQTGGSEIDVAARETKANNAF
jgi:hypothetical protein